MSTGAMVGVDNARLNAVCKRYGIAGLFVFGSVARGTPAPTSDVDLLYDLQPGARLGWGIEDLSDELAAILGRPVDIVARAALRLGCATASSTTAGPSTSAFCTRPRRSSSATSSTSSAERRPC